MKCPLILPLLFFSCIIGHSQTAYTIRISTTTPLRDALHICRYVAELNRFDGADYYKGLDSFYLYARDDDHYIILLVSARPDQDQDRHRVQLQFKLWLNQNSTADPGMLYNYSRRVSRKLANVAFGRPSAKKGATPPADPPPDNSDTALAWSAYPINHAAVYSAGIYETPSLFRRNIADSMDLKLTWRKDSVYILTLADTLSAEKIRLHETAKEEKQKLTDWSFTPVRRVLSYEGKLYVIIKYPVCLPLTRANDSFYFHIPRSYPNLKSLDRVQQKEANAWNPGGSGEGSAAGQLLGALAIAIVNVSVRTGIEGLILRKGKHDPNMRDGYLDLNTGEAKAL